VLGFFILWGVVRGAVIFDYFSVKKDAIESILIRKSGLLNNLELFDQQQPCISWCMG